MSDAVPAALSDDYPVELEAPDISPYRDGNTGVPYFTTFDSGRAGPETLITALVHGNELCGAIALDDLFRRGIRPLCGRLTLGFCNVAAYAEFRADYPALSRFIDEDLIDTRRGFRRFLGDEGFTGFAFLGEVGADIGVERAFPVIRRKPSGDHLGPRRVGGRTGAQCLDREPQPHDVEGVVIGSSGDNGFCGLTECQTQHLANGTN